MKRTKRKIPTGQQGHQRPKASRRAPAKKANAPLSARLRQRAEERLRMQRTGRKLGAGGQVAGADTERVVHELRVHQIELEMQNEELLQAQHELEVSREKYFDLYDLAPVGYLTLNATGRILEANFTAARLLGVARTDLVRQPLTRFILREDLGIFHQHRQQLFETRAPQHCELRLRRPGGTPIWVRGEAILAQDHATAEPVCRMTLSDLTALKQAEAARERFAQFERMAQLMKSASDSILLTNEHGRIVEANDRAVETYGYSLTELRQKTVEDLRTPESRAEFPRHAEQLEADGRAMFEATHQRRDGFAFPVEISARFLQIAGVRCRLCIVRDITERKRAEEKLRESELRFQAIANYTADWESWFGPDGKLLWINPAVERMTGYSVAECLAMPGFPRPLFAEEDRAAMSAWFQEAGGGSRGNDLEFRFLHKNGTKQWGAVSWQPILGGSGTSMGFRASVRDINDRKRAEAALHESELFLRSTLNSLTAHIAVLDRQGVIIAVNEAWKRFARENGAADTAAYLGANYLTVCEESFRRGKDESVAAALRGLRAVMNGEQDAFSLEYPCHSSNEKRWFSLQTTQFPGEGPVRLVVAHENITERKQAEEKLRESEAAARARADELAAVLAATPCLAFVARDRECRHMTSSHAALRLLRLPDGANTSKSAPPGERPETFRAMKHGRELRPNELPVQLAAATGQAVKNFELTLAFEDGTARDIVGDAVPLFDAKGNVRGAVGAFLDVTERKRAEESLSLLAQVSAASSDYIALVGPDFRYRFVNEVYLKARRLRPEDMVGHHMREIVGRERFEQLGRPQVEACLRGEAVEAFEWSDFGSDVPHFLHVKVTPFREPDGTVSGAVMSGRDITERQRAEQELRDSEEKFAAAFYASPNLMAITRIADGTILEVNEGYSRLLGYTRGESIGKTTADLSIWVDPADRATFVAHLKKSGRITDFETRLRHKDGSVLTVIDSARTIKLQDERCLLSVAYDITERKQAEKRVQMFSQEIIAAREEERKRVSSVLHHDVGSLTVGISAHLDAIEQDLRSGKPGEALHWMKRTRKLFDESVAHLKKLAIELRPPELDVLGLCAALRQHFAQVTENVGIRIHFRETFGRMRVPGDTATILFRAAQEALTNAITHGQAMRVEVALSASKKEVRLTIRNNGKEFNPSERRARAASQMGLRVMQEMAASAGGTFTIDAGRGKRTTVRVRLPIADCGLRNAD